MLCSFLGVTEAEVTSSAEPSMESEAEQTTEVAQIPAESADAEVIAEEKSTEVGNEGEDNVVGPTAAGEKTDEVRKRSVDEQTASDVDDADVDGDGNGEPPAKKNKQDNEEAEAEPEQNGDAAGEKKRQRSPELAKYIYQSRKHDVT